MEICSSEKETTTSIYVNETMNEIHFNSPINQSSVSKLITELLNLQVKIIKKEKKIREKFKDVDFNDEFCNLKISIDYLPIYLFLSTQGGGIYQAFSVVDTIHSMKVPVYTINKGFVASAGTIISLAGKKRYMTKNAYMLIHELRGTVWGKYSHLVESVDNCKIIMEHIKRYYFDNTKMTISEIDEQLRADQYWDFATCLKKGLVDDIWQ
jgi:ATP-dependent protease ClpP protease subunit